jgi:hypothetical protein
MPSVQEKQPRKREMTSNADDDRTRQMTAHAERVQALAKEIERLGDLAQQTLEYKADFLWGYGDDTPEMYGYEFCNARSEAYRRVMWDALVAKIKESCETCGRRVAVHDSERLP